MPRLLEQGIGRYNVGILQPRVIGNFSAVASERYAHPSAPTHTEGTGRRLSLAKISRAGLVHERLWVRVVLIEVAVDGGLKVDDGAEDAAPQAPSGQGREEILDGVEPGAGGRGEVEDPARMADEPGLDLGVLMGRVIVEDGMDQLADGDRALDGIEEADELLMGVLLHAATKHRAVEHVEGGEQGWSCRGACNRASWFRICRV